MKKAGKILVLSILTVFALSIIASFAFAADLGTGTTAVKDFGSTVLHGWLGGNLDINVAKILFAVIIGLIIYSLADILPFIGDKSYLAIPFAVVGSFLATAYLTPSEVFVMLSSWSAMGVTFGVIIPFLLVAAFQWKLATSAGTAPEVFRSEMLSYAIWAIYALVLAARLITAWVNPPEGFQWSTMAVIISLISLGLAIVAFFMVRQTFAMIQKGKQRTTTSVATQREITAAEATKRKALMTKYEAGTELSKGEKKEVEQLIEGGYYS